MVRNTAREIAIHLSYELSFTNRQIDELLDDRLTAETFATLAFEDEIYAEAPNAKQAEYIRRLVKGVDEHAYELDGYIAKYAKGWNFARIPLVASAIMRVAMFEIMYGQGISKWGELVDLAVQMDIVQKSGSWFSMGDERIGQGANSVKEYLMNNPEIAAEVEAKVRENLMKLSTAAPKAPAKAAEMAVAVSADDFDDED